MEPVESVGVPSSRFIVVEGCERLDNRSHHGRFGRDLALVEIAHQLAYECSKFAAPRIRGSNYHYWVVEGLATYLEVDRKNRRHYRPR